MTTVGATVAAAVVVVVADERTMNLEKVSTVAVAVAASGVVAVVVAAAVMFWPSVSAVPRQSLAPATGCAGSARWSTLRATQTAGSASRLSRRSPRAGPTRTEHRGPHPPRERPAPGDWKCAQCQFENYAKRDDCFRCGAVGEKRAPLRNNFFGPGDWICSGCTTTNFESRPECFQCQKTKDDTCDVIPGERRRGLSENFCSACKCSNFASREKCFKCEFVKDATCDVVPTMSDSPAS